MQGPNTYAEWVKVLGELKKGTDDARVLEAMRKGTLVWQEGVAERFTKRLIDTVNTRMNQAQDTFERTLKYGSGESAVVQALLDLRKTYFFLVQVMNIPVIPEEHRREYADLVRKQADQVQQSLEESAKNDHTGRLLSIVKNNRMNAFSIAGEKDE